MRLSVAVAVLAPALSAYASNILVLLAFSPSNVTANVGDTVTFQFQSKNHSVTQSSFASPCTPLAGGVDSGFQFVAANAANIPEFSLTISNASKPLFFFSKQDAVVNECQKGMVFSINADPNSAKSFAAFQAAAEASAAPAASSSASSGSNILVLLAFSPSNVTANAGDTVTFQFQSKNHSVTQSSFASPCTPLVGGVDSGFHDASKPLFFFSKQDAVVNECQKGMVFSINADPNSAESFAAFQAAAEESAASSSSAPTAGASSGSEILVLVGQNNQLTFSPSNITANAGDTVTFQFQSKNHSVTQSSFEAPCTPLAGGVDSGFQFIAANATALPEFSFTINNAAKPLFFFSKQDAVVNECQKGMVFSINADPNSAESFAAFQAAAEESAASSSSAPAAGASSGSEILVLVGQNNQLTFSPSNITANVGDTVTFQFQSKNHSVTQSSFASPCTPLLGGVDSGFQAVTPDATAFPEFSFTLNNASTPLFFFSKQDALVSECQKGMVFSINANPDSAKSFAAFQANAEASVAPSAKASKKLQRKHSRDFASAAKVARK
ncbi:Cupredoxin [Mycena venus]|uniref:Cupredoxin n=1 Tax=Mycena venus TaxID=2733690 RepID=A0A8H6YRV1_9AGAR|nr:Cupredoxin [Mycena venus]